MIIGMLMEKSHRPNFRSVLPDSRCSIKKFTRRTCVGSRRTDEETGHHKTRISIGLKNGQTCRRSFLSVKARN